MGAVGPIDETCNGIDDDCNGSVDDIVEICDLVDDDCDSLVDEGNVCTGLVSSYWSRFWPPEGSGVLPASMPLYLESGTITISPTPCPSGQIRLEDAPSHVACVPAPPTNCPSGTRYQWDGTAWQCVQCAVLVQFGGIYAYERTCAPPPLLSCPPGESPTFSVDTRAWQCIGTCSNGQYDQAYHDGLLVCVPC